MSQIGSFTRSNDGTYTGTIKTLAIDAKARHQARLQRTTRRPTRVAATASRSVPHGAGPKENRAYHSVKLDDPSFTAPIYANLVEGENGEHTDLVALISPAAPRQTAGRRGHRPVIMRSDIAPKPRKTTLPAPTLRIITHYA